MLFAEIKGKGQPIVFLHGIVGSHRYWNEVVKNVPKGYKTVATDLLGYGQSAKPKDASYTLQQHANEVAKVLAASNVENPIIVGHSLGALVAIKLAASNELRVQKVVLISAPLFIDPIKAKRIIKRSSLVPRGMVFGPTAWLICKAMCYARPLIKPIIPLLARNVPSEVAKDSLMHTWHSYDKTLHNSIINQAAEKDLINLKPELIVVNGDKDEVVAGQGDFIFPKNTHIAILKNASHNIPIERPDAIVELIIHKEKK